MSDWLTTDPWKFGAVGVSVLLGVMALIGLNRLFGLRSFSKLSGFDFAITVAFGSVLAGTVMAEDPPVVQGVAALFFLFALQAGIAFARTRWPWARELVNNKPRLVWHEGEFLSEQMKKAQITRSDIVAKMREANALRMDDVLAVVVETTGDISVLHKTGDDRDVDPAIMEGVIGWTG
ncbi:DUF421 domain-containing protein [Algimonas porphyrae]|uniref:DUF421 domain-containing protein n=1 Tax=Algimonas porphyrae TaxID=1128113 RepID=A0ABQ5V2F9_9PROT|nr:YetF domain-containing protein [Algimonas porphyrae]GLQ21129.1 DUF421 domain-containing protein [Algimonas porphyrae]